jgi:SAM-dependent methyltransferase
MTEPARIDLGCGAVTRPGFVGLDQVEGPGVDHVLDLTRDRYPFPDRSVDEVYSAHFLEHIEAPNHVFGEIARICKDGARIEFWTPYAFSDEAFLYGHLHFITEEMWMHFCVSQRDYHADLLKGRWQLHRIVYVVLPATLEDLAHQGVGLDFAIRYLKGVVHELGVEIEFRAELGVPATVPERVFATSRDAERRPVDTWEPPGAAAPRRGRFGSRLARRIRPRAGERRRR